MTTTTDAPVITRFVQASADASLTGARDVLVPWSEVHATDFVLMQDVLGPIVRTEVYLDDWGDGTKFIRVDVLQVHENGWLGSSERKGDELTCVRRALDDSPKPMTEAWAAWAQDASVAPEDRCWCNVSRYRPHPPTVDYGHVGTESATEWMDRTAGGQS